ncbi:transcription antitermination factor NusB [Alicyclobacillus cycloheptanicus]|uniref:Transcription antitermination protein NusB n=1 Tax=Alicyclobacillus cycloheptanicus TaxID=1457 RepID=A0ABT9XDI6_9BACL|nr:transcription antitermination factor NusB [Alicyclobacillus cycloheptanicus]MDQ0188362.1 N utilization substance protein B [Alicyclobacillus cycloheptanicus]WDM01070.1 transcription antitermination factor NusB [Alicyclobacillus cycloheptanicus]
MKRHEARQCALQALYQIDVGKGHAHASIRHVLEEFGHAATERDVAYIERLVTGTESEQADIDELLGTHVEGWKLDRIARVDLNILRLAVYELRHELDVDAATIVDEAVELAKDFGSDESGRFVNGVLARMLPVTRPTNDNPSASGAESDVSDG